MIVILITRQVAGGVVRGAGRVRGGRGVLLPSGRALRVRTRLLRPRRHLLPFDPARAALPGRGPLRGPRPLPPGPFQPGPAALPVRARLLRRRGRVPAVEGPRGDVLQARPVRGEHGVLLALRGSLPLPGRVVPGRGRVPARASRGSTLLPGRAVRGQRALLHPDRGPVRVSRRLLRGRRRGRGLLGPEGGREPLRRPGAVRGPRPLRAVSLHLRVPAGLLPLPGLLPPGGTVQCNAIE